MNSDKDYLVGELGKVGKTGFLLEHAGDTSSGINTGKFESRAKYEGLDHSSSKGGFEQQGTKQGESNTKSGKYEHKGLLSNAEKDITQQSQSNKEKYEQGKYEKGKHGYGKQEQGKFEQGKFGAGKFHLGESTFESNHPKMELNKFLQGKFEQEHPSKERNDYGKFQELDKNQ